MAEHATSIASETSPEAKAAAESPAAIVPENPFNRDDIAQFDADDVAAGKSIGVMLSWFFLYTVVVMSLAAWWTISQTM
jgi:hypothetical protein